MKKLNFIWIFALLLVSCQGVKKEIMTTYPDGKPQIAYYTKESKGKKERVKEEMYYENGNVRYTGNFEDEKPSGKWQFFYSNGKLFAEAEFEKSNPNDGKNWKFYNPDGSPLIKDPGQLEVKMGPDKSPIELKDIRGNHAAQILFHTDYSLKGKGNLENGMRTGKWIYWFPNGNIQTEGVYVNGALEGLQTVYFPNGNIYYKGNYINGKRIGIWEFFDENGNLTGVKDFSSSQSK